jgi:putative ABC transport system permease protein
LARSPGFTAVAVLTLALGIGANTAIFSVVNAVLLRPLPYPESDRLVALAEVESSDEEPVTTSFGTFSEWKARSRTFQHMALYRKWSPTLLGGEEPERVEARRVSADFFSVLGVRPVLGRDFRPEEDRPDQWRVVLLSHNLWQRHFHADPEVVGKTVSLNGTAYTVVGVMRSDFRPAFFEGVAQPIELWAPLGYGPEQPWACRSCRHLQAVARLRSEVPLEQARAEINTIERSLVGEFPNDFPETSSVAVTPLKERLVGDVHLALMVLLGTVGFVLLIGCVNVANLILARAAGREREMAIRSALGAGRGRLLRQLLTESMLLALVGGGAGLSLSLWGVELLSGLGAQDIPRLGEASLDARVLVGTLLVSLLAGLLVGIAPAMGPSRLNLSAALKEGARVCDGRGHARLRATLVTAEIALACLLSVGAGLLIRSFVQLLNVDPGFETRYLLTFTTHASGPRYEGMEASAQFYHEAFDRIEALPGVEAVGAVTPLPLSSGFDRAGFLIEERPVAHDSEAPSVDRYCVNGDYLRAMRIPLLSGRDFSEEEKATGAPVVLISQSTAHQFWPNQDPIGKRVKLGGSTGPWLTIVGIVGDVRQYGLHATPTNQVYATGATEPGLHLTVVVRASSPPAALERPVREAIWLVDKERPIYGVATMDQVIAESVAQRRFAMLLLAAFAGLALLLALVGIYGVMAYSVTERTHEIGIRSALGATRRQILELVLGQAMVFTAAGIGLGLLGAAALTRLLATLLFEVKPIDAVTFASVAVLLAFVALLACLIPARRAARVDPMVALRYE